MLRDERGRIAGIVEARHATPEQLAMPEVNSGIYCFQTDWLWSRLDQLEPHDNGEYYLTDLVEIAVREGAPLATVSGSHRGDRRRQRPRTARRGGAHPA